MRKTSRSQQFYDEYQDSRYGSYVPTLDEYVPVLAALALRDRERGEKVRLEAERGERERLTVERRERERLLEKQRIDTERDKAQATRIELDHHKAELVAARNERLKMMTDMGQQALTRGYPFDVTEGATFDRLIKEVNVIDSKANKAGMWIW